MRTMFTIQGAGTRTAFLAQAGVGPLSEADRNKLLNDLADAGDKLQAMNAWIQAHPNAQAALGADYQAYQDASGNMGHFGGTAASVQQRLASPDPANWAISAQDLNDAQNWITFVNQIYAIIQRHGATPAVPGASRGLLPGQIAPAAAPAIPTGVLVGGGIAAALLVGIALLK